MLKPTTMLLAAVMFAAPAAGAGDTARIEADALATMPVKEVTVFKDGHAFVLHEGEVATDARGHVHLAHLPNPVVGTFWAYSSEPRARLEAVVASRCIVTDQWTALTISEMIEANVGRKVRLREWTGTPAACVVTGREVLPAPYAKVPDPSAAVLAPAVTLGPVDYEATILGIPGRTTGELRRTAEPGTPEQLPVRGSVVLLKVGDAVRAVPLERIKDVTFLDEPEPRVKRDGFRNVMTVRLDWDRGKPAKEARVGMMYVQRGIRWVPNYRVDIDGKGTARIKLQATLINELADLDGVKAHLVVGVPKFVFQDTPDPISLQEAVAQLSRHFRPETQTAFAFSNAMMTQVSMPVRQRPEAAGGGGRVIDLGPDVAAGAKNEDLYVFTLDRVTLEKGQRMVVPVAEFELKYRDVFVLDVPFGPPPEARQRLNNDQQAQLARLFLAPKVMHKVRLANDSKAPITTAPALVLRNGRLVAQGMTTYTPVGASSDLELTTAVDIPVETLDLETGRTPNAANWGGYTYDRINLAGEIRLTNHRGETVEVQVRRSVLGNIDEASAGGRIEQLGWHESGWFTVDGAPFWWGWYSWPYWWYHFNSVGRITWDLKVEPGETRELEYEWHYFWRH